MGDRRLGSDCISLLGDHGGGTATEIFCGILLSAEYRYMRFLGLFTSNEAEIYRAVYYRLTTALGPFRTRSESRQTPDTTQLRAQS